MSTTDTAPTPTADPRAGRRSRRAVARSAGRERRIVGLIGLLALLVGAGTALLAFGVFGSGRAHRPLLDPILVDALRAQPLIWRIVALLVCAVLVVAGLVWAVRALAPERRPDLTVDAGPDTSVVVTSSAVAEAVAGQARTLPGISRARARMVGDEREPALRLTVWLAEDADVAEVCRRIPGEVLASATDAFGGRVLPVAVRIEADSAEGPRVH
jgi:hypothetical protein